MASDENERVLQREQLARRELERLNQAKDQFVATLSHELRTPLNAITGWTAILKRSSTDPQLLARALDVIDRNARAQTRLISDLLDVSRIASGKLLLDLAETELLPTFAQAADVLRPVAEAKGVRLVTDLSPDLGVLRADADRLAQITWNLLSNAIRFTPRGGTVSLSVHRSEREVVMEVRDDGMGIAPADQPLLFERFNQVDSSITRAHGGLGLGLAIVKHLVEAHGGTAEGRSDGLGCGATFVMRFPVTEDSSLPPGRVTGLAPERGPITLEGTRVLVVDDDPDSLEFVRTILELASARVTACSRVEEATRRLPRTVSRPRARGTRSTSSSRSRRRRSCAQSTS
ncbi:MAG: hybrid sensor histidine kinase/response regulator [Polyangiaceae bacterium]